MQIRKFGKTREVVPVPSLVNLQSRSYDEFLDAEAVAEARDGKKGLEAIYREFFPITGLDDKIQVTYHGYVFTQPQHTIDECRDLGLTYQRGIKLKIRVAGARFNQVLEVGQLVEVRHAIAVGIRRRVVRRDRNKVRAVAARVDQASCIVLHVVNIFVVTVVRGVSQFIHQLAHFL